MLVSQKHRNGLNMHAVLHKDVLVSQKKTEMYSTCMRFCIKTCWSRKKNRNVLNMHAVLHKDVYRLKSKNNVMCVQNSKRY